MQSSRFLKNLQSSSSRRSRAVLEAFAILLIAVFPRPGVSQTFTVLHAFVAGPDGAAPYGGLVRDRAGNFYGTTSTGGTFGNGTIYKITPSGQEKILHRFIKAEGGSPMDSLTIDSAGNLYGTTEAAGFGAGTVFEFSRGGKLKLLYRFGEQGGGFFDGGNPYAGVLLDSAGNLYGTTPYGGSASHGGTIYKLDSSGNETILHNFGQQPDGVYPFGGLVVDSDGNFYGTTNIGGEFGGGYGTVYKLDASGNEAVLYSFNGNDGHFPSSSLVRDTAGNLYGTTSQGGTYDGGIVFKIDPTGTLTTLYNFGGVYPDGFNPVAGLTPDSTGNFYGTTFFGGLYANGAVYKLDPSGQLTVLHSFSGGSDGSNPNAGLIRDAQGNLYGTTATGGDSICGCGVVFEITP